MLSRLIFMNPVLCLVLWDKCLVTPQDLTNQEPFTKNEVCSKLAKHLLIAQNQKFL